MSLLPTEMISPLSLQGWCGWDLVVICTLGVFRLVLPNFGFTDKPSLVQMHTHQNTEVHGRGQESGREDRRRSAVLQVGGQVLLHHLHGEKGRRIFTTS